MANTHTHTPNLFQGDKPLCSTGMNYHPDHTHGSHYVMQTYCSVSCWGHLHQAKSGCCISLSATVILCSICEMHFLHHLQGWTLGTFNGKPIVLLNTQTQEIFSYCNWKLWYSWNPINATVMHFQVQCLFLLLILLTANRCNCLAFSISGSFVHFPIFGAD